MYIIIVKENASHLHIFNKSIASAGCLEHSSGNTVLLRLFSVLRHRRLDYVIGCFVIRLISLLGGRGCRCHYVIPCQNDLRRGCDCSLTLLLSCILRLMRRRPGCSFSTMTFSFLHFQAMQLPSQYFTYNLRISSLLLLLTLRFSNKNLLSHTHTLSYTHRS